MLERLSPTRRNLALLVLAILVLWFCWSIRAVLNPLLIGYLLAYILHPFVVWVEQHGFSRRAAVNLIFFAGFLLATAVTLGLVLEARDLAYEVIARFKPEAEEVIVPDPGDAAVGGPDEALEPEAPPQATPTLDERIEEFNSQLAEWLPEGMAPHIELPDLSALREAAREFLAEHGDEVASAAGASAKAAGRAFSFAGAFLGKLVTLGGLFFLVPLYTYYLLFELGRLHGFVRRYLPVRDRERLSQTAESIGKVLASFFRGRLGVCLVKGFLLWLGLWAVGIPNAFLFGMLSGFLSLIPFFGPFLGFVAATSVGLLEHGVIGSLVRTGIVFGLGEVLEGYVLIPKILGDSLGLHPLVVLFAMLAGGAAMGMFGILIALPLTASLVIVAKEFVLPAMRDMADEDDGPGGGGRAAPSGG